MSYLGETVDKIDTPALLVDLDILENNLKIMYNIAKNNGVNLRPHIKTHKTPEIAHMQLQNGAVGITAAKLSEAEVFVNAGIRDVFVAFPIVGDIKAKRAALLAKRCRLIIGVDSALGIEALSKAAVQYNSKIEVRIEINSGLDRSGVLPDQVYEIAEKVTDSDGLELNGIYTHRGAYFGGARSSNIEEVGRQEGEYMVEVAEALRMQGYTINEVSLGSTPTARYASQVYGVTEIRPGTYVFNDNQQICTGEVAEESVALTILTTVVSKPSKGIVTIDGGSKTFQGDMPSDKLDIGLKGYATVKNNKSIYLARMSEEHGVLRIEDDSDLTVGDRIPLIPNHVCPTVNLSDYLIGVRNGIVEVEWKIAARGKRE